MNDLDLSHINKQIQKNSVEIEAKRQQAQNYRMMSNQTPDNSDYYEKEADNLEDQAMELENELDQLQLEKERKESQLARLEEQKASVGQEHADRLARIEQEIIALRGSDMML